jgi:hypothetical protein
VNEWNPVLYGGGSSGLKNFHIPYIYGSFEGCRLFFCKKPHPAGIELKIYYIKECLADVDFFPILQVLSNLHNIYGPDML